MIELNKIYQEDCLYGLKKLPDECINLVIADPPYYKIKKDKWDNAWKSFDDYLNWIEEVMVECKRVLKENGSLYIFGDDERIAYIQVRLDKHFTFLNHLVWHKPNNMPIKYAHNHRKFCPMSERILFYSKQKSKTGLQETMNYCVEPIRNYLRDEIVKSKGEICFKEINKAIGGATNGGGLASGFLSLNKDVPIMITKENYLKLKDWLGKGYLEKEYEDLRKEYEDLRKEYEDLRKEYEDLRRPFNFQKNIYEVISIPIITQKENTNHSTTKPLKLIRLLVKASSNEGDIILDPFMGSGTSAHAAYQLKRYYIGFELEQKYIDIAQKRLNQKVLLPLEDKSELNDQRQLI